MFVGIEMSASSQLHKLSLFSKEMYIKSWKIMGTLAIQMKSWQFQEERLGQVLTLMMLC